VQYHAECGGGLLKKAGRVWGGWVYNGQHSWPKLATRVISSVVRRRYVDEANNADPLG
jgi:hypothetical protein